MRFFVRKSCGKSHFFLVEKSIVVYKTEGSEKYVCEKRRADLGGPLECESNACKKKTWILEVSIPLPLECESNALPFELKTLNSQAPLRSCQVTKNEN